MNKGKSLIFGGLSFLFLLLFFWQFSQFDLTRFHAYNLIEFLAQLWKTKDFTLFLPFVLFFLFLGLYLINLAYFALLTEKIFIPVLAIFIPLELWLVFITTTPHLLFFSLAFCLLSLLFTVQVSNAQKNYVSLNFIDLFYKKSSRFAFYALLFLCFYSFFLIKDRPFLLPQSLFDLMLKQMDQTALDSTFSVENQPTKKIDFQTPLCNQSVPAEKESCLIRLKQTLGKDNLEQIFATLNIRSVEDITFAHLINLKTKQFLQPYQKIIPLLLTSMLFSVFYFGAILILYAYLFIAGLIHFVLRTADALKIKTRTVEQEFLS